VDQLATRSEAVAGAQTVDDLLRAQHVLGPREPAVTVADHDEVALILAGEEVLRRTPVVRFEHAAVVPVGTGEEPPVAAFAEQRVPYAPHPGAVHAGAAIRRAADRVDVHACDVVATDRILAALAGRAVTRLRLEAERDPPRGLVEVR